MTLHSSEMGVAHNTYTPPVDTGETIVPVYARKAPKRSTKKMLLWAIPAVLALGVSAWALTLGGEGREEATVAEADTNSLTTSRLSTMETPPASEPLAVSATPVGDMPPPVAAPVAEPSPALRPTPSARTSAAAARRVAPRASAPARTKATPLPQETLSPAISDAPPTVVPTPVLPADPAPQAVPPATTVPPGGF